MRGRDRVEFRVALKVKFSVGLRVRVQFEIEVGSWRNCRDGLGFD